MPVLESLRAWTNPELPSTPTYGALARFAVRRGALVAVIPVAGQFAVLLLGGDETPLALLVGAVVAAAVAYLAGIAVAFDDRGRAVVATAASAGVLLATWAAMRSLAPAPGRDLVVGLVAFAALAPLAAGIAGYTFAERATWRAED
ncbi:hypothetical protein [Halorubellus sp. PRR65]|uniref:hypothetical protein n=1 Tax=Halorubellus sp. PRR65 TaxID=3098148 RepID=UPI002B25D163|nr:hypothetical protein [Halorubellus sp. PRR65]